MQIIQFHRGIDVLRLVAFLVMFSYCHISVGQAPVPRDNEEEIKREGEWLSNVRQLTFEGRRAGEGYFSSDGKQMVFQSERYSGNPFFQIYLMDMETGDIEQVSPGHGKTTCAWIHPDGNKVLYASTHSDPKAKEKQEKELEDRAAGRQKRYSWDYDEHFEIYAHDPTNSQTTRLTNATGYDAEGSYSPDGKWIAFASNRQAYERKLTDKEQEKFRLDKAYFNEIYIMAADGSDVRRLTNSAGYDGGPFFSPDGERICWRRFNEDGSLAEIMTMKVDGSDQKQITRLNAMSWAPYYHPSGEYLIFTTNRHGFSNFELYIADTEAKSPPVRVTDTDGFDGLPVFTPDGKRLAWTTNRTASKQSQIYMADWNHELALKRLGITAPSAMKKGGPSPISKEAIAGDPEAEREARTVLAKSSADFKAEDMLRHVDYLCRPELEGRLTGTAGERKATAYFASYLDSLGIQPSGEAGSWYQPFEFTSGISLGTKNQLTQNGKKYAVDRDWRPLAFSSNGEFGSAAVVFAGYGIQAPKDEDQEEYDSFVHLDVKGKWVLCLRFLPEGVTAERRQHLARYSSLRFKAMKLRDMGAAGVVVVSGPTSKVKKQVVPLRFDGSMGGSSLPVISISDAVAEEWLAASGKSLAGLQAGLDGGEMAMGFELPNVKLAATVSLKNTKKVGRNVLGVLRVADQPTEQQVIVGAHIDHLGRGTGGSLARDDEVNQIHFGADDNASGVAAVLEVAQYLVGQQRSGKLRAKRDIVFAAWSGEELGLLGSSHYVNAFEVPAADSHGHGHAAAHGHEAVGPVKGHVGNSHGANPHAVNPHAANPPAANPHGANPHGASPHGKDSHGASPHGANPHGASPHGKDSHGASPHGKDLRGSNPHGTNPHVAKHEKNPHGSATTEAHGKSADNANAHGAHAAKNGSHSQGAPDGSLHPTIAAYLNMDMVGRFEKRLVLQGVGSSSIWPGEIERRNAPIGLPITIQNDSYLPTDASAFFIKGVPILAAFTGSHSEYHTPRDTPDRLNYKDAARIAKFMGLVARSVAKAESAPDYVAQARPDDERPRAGLRAYLGTIPDYAQTDVKGVKLSGVGNGGPAQKAGIKGGDIVIGLAGKKIENIYDYTYAIDAVKIGQKIVIEVTRDGKSMKFDLVPASRE